MILKIIVVAVVLYILYKALGGNFKLPTKKSKESVEKEDNTLVECCKCGVYITQKEAIKKGDCFYCQECIKG
jgi:polyferredoxin